MHRETITSKVPLASSYGESVMSAAKTWIGTPYQAGGNRKGITGGVDCSHFVHEVYKDAGLAYPYRDTAAFPPAGYFTRVPDDEEAMPGDVVLFAGHMAIVTNGHTEEVISAQGSPTRPGKVQLGRSRWFRARQGTYRWSR